MSNSKKQGKKRSPLTAAQIECMDAIHAIKPHWDISQKRKFCEDNRWDLNILKGSIERLLEYESSDYDSENESWEMVKPKSSKKVARTKAAENTRKDTKPSDKKGVKTQGKDTPNDSKDTKTDKFDKGFKKGSKKDGKKVGSEKNGRRVKDTKSVKKEAYVPTNTWASMVASNNNAKPENDQVPVTDTNAEDAKKDTVVEEKVEVKTKPRGAWAQAKGTDVVNGVAVKVEEAKPVKSVDVADKVVEPIKEEKSPTTIVNATVISPKPKVVPASTIPAQVTQAPVTQASTVPLTTFASTNTKTQEKPIPVVNATTTTVKQHTSSVFLPDEVRNLEPNENIRFGAIYEQQPTIPTAAHPSNTVNSNEQTMPQRVSQVQQMPVHTGENVNEMNNQVSLNEPEGGPNVYGGEYDAYHHATNYRIPRGMPNNYMPKAKTYYPPYNQPAMGYLPKRGPGSSSPSSHPADPMMSQMPQDAYKNQKMQSSYPIHQNMQNQPMNNKQYPFKPQNNNYYAGQQQQKNKQYHQGNMSHMYYPPYYAQFASYPSHPGYYHRFDYDGQDGMKNYYDGGYEQQEKTGGYPSNVGNNGNEWENKHVKDNKDVKTNNAPQGGNQMPRKDMPMHPSHMYAYQFQQPYPPYPSQPAWN